MPGEHYGNECCSAVAPFQAAPLSMMTYSGTNNQRTSFRFQTLLMSLCRLRVMQCSYDYRVEHYDGAR